LAVAIGILYRETIHVEVVERIDDWTSKGPSKCSTRSIPVLYSSSIIPTIITTADAGTLPCLEISRLEFFKTSGTIICGHQARAVYGCSIAGIMICTTTICNGSCHRHPTNTITISTIRMNHDVLTLIATQLNVRNGRSQNNIVRRRPSDYFIRPIAFNRHRFSGAKFIIRITSIINLLNDTWLTGSP